jgi:hypothetical protein
MSKDGKRSKPEYDNSWLGEFKRLGKGGFWMYAAAAGFIIAGIITDEPVGIIMGGILIGVYTIAINWGKNRP